MFSIHFVKKDLHIRTNIDILVPKFQFKISYTICVIFCINPFVIFPPCCRIVTFASTHIPHSKCTVYDNDLIFASWLHHRRWSASNQRTYLKFLEMTFLAMDFYLVKEKSIYNIFEIWVFSSLLMYTSIYILKMVTTPWALLFCYSWINKILSVNVPLCSSIDVVTLGISRMSSICRGLQSSDINQKLITCITSHRSRWQSQTHKVPVSSPRTNTGAVFSTLTPGRNTRSPPLMSQYSEVN